MSSLFCSVSLREFVVPAEARIVTSLDLPQVIAAVSSLVRVRSLSTSVTPVVPFFTLMEPSAQLPETV